MVVNPVILTQAPLPVAPISLSISRCNCAYNQHTFTKTIKYANIARGSYDVLVCLGLLPTGGGETHATVDIAQTRKDAFDDVSLLVDFGPWYESIADIGHFKESYVFRSIARVTCRGEEVET